MKITGGKVVAFFLVTGLIFLYLGAEALVKGSGSMALRAGLPPFAVGMIVVGYGTGMPELVVSVDASLASRGELAVGNVIGSNICNIGLILGLSALIKPLMLKKRVVRYEIPLMIVITAAVYLLLFDGDLSRWKSALLLLGLAVYTAWVLVAGKKEGNGDSEEIPLMTPSVWIDFLFILIGVAALWAGGELFVKGAVLLAQWIGVNDAAIGLTVVAFGTSLPELATSVVAVIRGHRDLAIGNIVGSNIFNLLGIIGVSGMIYPFRLQEIGNVDFAVLFLYTAATLLLMRRDRGISRVQGFVFLLGYLAFFLWQLTINQLPSIQDLL